MVAFLSGLEEAGAEGGGEAVRLEEAEGGAMACGEVLVAGDGTVVRPVR